MSKQVVASSEDLARGANIGPDGKPECRNMRLIGHCGMDGRGDIFHINVVKGYAFCGHQGTSRIGTSIIDVHDPRKPFVVARYRRPRPFTAPRCRSLTMCFWSTTKGSAGISMPVLPNPAKNPI